jgi:hypothetical protein
MRSYSEALRQATRIFLAIDIAERSLPLHDKADEPVCTAVLGPGSLHKQPAVTVSAAHYNCNARKMTNAVLNAAAGMYQLLCAGGCQQPKSPPRCTHPVQQTGTA